MKEILEKIKNADSKVQLVVLAIVVLLVIIIGFSSFGNDLGGSKEDTSINVDNNISGDELEISEEDKVVAKEKVSSLSPVTFSKVKIATLAGPVYEGKIPGKKRSCDTVVMVDRNIQRTTAPLNGALKDLFSFSSGLDFVPGNFINSQEKLDFSEARIENGIAKVYLTGETGPIVGDCDTDRIKIQIEETAFQFNTVKAVEIYLNGNKI